MTPAGLLAFWFAPEHERMWFRATPAFDAQIRERYLDLWQAARDGALDAWRDSPDGALALVLLFDQLPLNMFRDRPEGYATEADARVVADHAIASGFDRGYNDTERAFLYLPFMHSEELHDQERSVALFEAAGMADNLRWARHHRDIVRRFGRFPHRNAVLGRDSTADELTWLASPGSFKP